jgi:ABC-type lipoprotein release transport system permease subunit
VTPFTVIRRSVRFYWRTHLGVILGTALAAMVLVGSLLVGDSVKATLRHQAELRIGRANAAMTGGEHQFRAELATAVGGAPILIQPTSVARTDGSARINNAQALGVDQRFWPLAPQGNAAALAGEDIALNERAAAQLRVKPGDAVVLRLEQPGAFSRDAPLSGEEGEVVAIRANVGRIIADAEFGRFGLSASQIPPFTVFLPLEFLQQRLSAAGKANLILVGNNGTAASLDQSVRQSWSLEDAGIEIRQLPNQHGWELRSSRVFLEQPLVDSAPKGGVESLTYFVNALALGSKATPYSMVAAVDAPSSGFLPAELADDEIAITQWLADDLGATLNQRVTLKYFVMGERRQLTEKSREFEIIQIIPMNEPQLDSSWMPDFPGLSDQENCRDWKPGFAIDTKAIRDVDEAYWKQYRGTPKAFVNLKIGQEMWGNRWGNVTAIRWPAATDRATIEQELRARLTPQMLGFQFIPLREQAFAATDAPVDFGELFVSFSFFLIAAAAVLTGLLFVFTLEQRNAEAGTLLALGLTPKLVRRMLLGEGAALAVIGSVLGCAAAVLYTHLVLRGLGTVWRGAVGTSEFVFSANPISLIGGGVGSIFVALLAMWWASRKQFKHRATELLAGEATWQQVQPSARRKSIPVVSIIASIAAVSVALFGGKSAEAFFGAGALLLIAGLGFSRAFLRKEEAKSFASTGDLARRNTGRRVGRSLATIAVLAAGVFMVVAVDSFRQRPSETQARDSGTGGFALVGESASPIYEDLNSAKGRESYALDESAMMQVHVVPLRVREGDDASCLNLNRALQPRLLAVKPEDLAGRFRFAQKNTDWAKLGDAESDGAIPGIVDANTLQWAMQKKLGDTIEYRDERGQPFNVHIVATLSGSMLQGSIVIAEQHLIEKYPGSGGYRFFLIDAPAGQTSAVSDELSRALQDRGMELTPASRRLAEFQAVENTYLSIFQALGGLGLLLGTAGLAIVVARNVLERRREFGLLEAVGFRARQLRSLVFAEHRWLIFLGLLVGTASALLGVWPQLASTAGGFPWMPMLGLLLALTIGCVFWAWLATRVALRGSRLAALRSE